MLVIKFLSITSVAKMPELDLDKCSQNARIKNQLTIYRKDKCSQNARINGQKDYAK